MSCFKYNWIVGLEFMRIYLSTHWDITALSLQALLLQIWGMLILKSLPRFLHTFLGINWNSKILSSQEASVRALSTSPHSFPGRSVQFADSRQYMETSLPPHPSLGRDYPLCSFTNLVDKSSLSFEFALIWLLVR